MELQPAQSFKLDYGQLAHPLEHPRIWKCPITGMPVPKRTLENLDYRRELLARAESDTGMQRALQAISAKSFLFWSNTFAWTYVQRDNRPKVILAADAAKQGKHRTARQPMITWPVQDSLATDIIEAGELEHDLIIDKARDMGATWIELLVDLHLWLYRPDTAILLGSVVRDKIDKPGNPDALFWKLDFAYERLPRWMKPEIDPNFDRTHMHFENPTNRSVIDGETVGDDFGRSGRRYKTTIDEGAAVQHLQAAWYSCADTTDCRIGISTPRGPGDWSELRFSGVKTFVLGYWGHPVKGQGRELKHHPYFDRVIWCTPWLDHQIYVRHRPKKDLSANQLIDHEGAGSMVFESETLNLQLATYANRRAQHVGDLVFDPNGSSRHTGIDQRSAIRRGLVACFRFIPNPAGKLRLWCDLVKDRQGLLRPRQDHVVAIGCDISTGVGASNSIGALGDATTKHKIGEYATAAESPDQFAYSMATLGWWLGGPQDFAFLSWENNGPGQRFGIVLRELAYPWLDRDRPDGKTHQGKATDVMGWTNRTQSMITICEELRGDMQRNEFRDCVAEALQEMWRYVWYETGGIGPAGLEYESADAVATHGDRVVANLVLNRAWKRCPKVDPEKFRPPHGSQGWIEQQEKGEEPKVWEA